MSTVCHVWDFSISISKRNFISISTEVNRWLQIAVEPAILEIKAISWNYYVYYCISGVLQHLIEKFSLFLMCSSHFVSWKCFLAPFKNSSKLRFSAVLCLTVMFPIWKLPPNIHLPINCVCEMVPLWHTFSHLFIS